jgi:hypothetical protein
VASIIVDLDVTEQQLLTTWWQRDFNNRAIDARLVYTRADDGRQVEIEQVQRLHLQLHSFAWRTTFITPDLSAGEYAMEVTLLVHESSSSKISEFWGTPRWVRVLTVVQGQPDEGCLLPDMASEKFPVVN